MKQARKRRGKARPAQPDPLAIASLPEDLPNHIREELEFTKHALEEQCSPAEIAALQEERRQRLRQGVLRVLRTYGINPPGSLDPNVLLSKRENALKEARRWNKAAKAAQRWRAQRPRPDALQRAIVEILRANPTAKREDVIKGLERIHRGGGIIERIENGEIDWHNEDGSGAETSKLTNLKDRIYRARTSLKESKKSR